NFLLIKMFMNPVAIAISSTSIHIIKTIWFLYLASSLLKISFFNFFPLKSLSKLALHSGIIALGIVFLNKYIYFSDILLIKVLVSAILYAVLILISAPLFNINYWENLTPIITIFKKNLISGYKI